MVSSQPHFCTCAPGYAVGHRPFLGFEREAPMLGVVCNGRFQTYLAPSVHLPYPQVTRPEATVLWRSLCRSWKCLILTVSPGSELFCASYLLCCTRPVAWTHFVFCKMRVLAETSLILFPVPPPSVSIEAWELSGFYSPVYMISTVTTHTEPSKMALSDFLVL